MTGPRDRPGWWHENRYWLPALPLVLVAALAAASGSSVKENWYDVGLHEQIASAPSGVHVEATSDYEDALGATTRTFSVRLAGLEPTEGFPYDSAEDPAPPPDGLEAVVAHLDWEADPDQVLRGCTVALVDEDGRRYEVIAETRQDECVPFGREGPEAPSNVDQERGTLPPYTEPRPERWSTAPVFLVPEGRRITQVLVWWQLPQHVALSAS